MVSQSNDPVDGHPVFTAGGAPELGVDETEVAEYAAEVGNRIVKANLAALDAYGYKRSGLRGLALDTGYEYECSGSSWLLIRTGIFGRVVRASTTPALATGAWYDASVNANWTADVVRGIGAYANGWTIPLTGRYRISYELRASGGFAAAVSRNQPTPASVDVVLATSPAVMQGVIAFTTATGDLNLSAGDTIRIHALSSTGAPILDASKGYFSIEWIGRT